MKGPSKEALAEYFKNNRMYFDSLAEQYKESDPEYYNTYIAPFYSNPFLAAKSARKGCSAKITLLVSIMALIAGLGAVSFFLTKSGGLEKEIDKAIEKQFDKGIEQIQKEAVDPDNMKKSIKPSDKLDTLSSVQNLNDFQKGSMYFSLGDYEKAETYFSQVKSDDPLFGESRKKLSEIRKKKLENSNRKSENN